MIKIKIKNLILISIFSAVTCICSLISIPAGAVPINLALLPVFICSGVLCKGSAAASQIIFVLIGFIGVPVFSGFRGGIGVVFGPTGGYILGYIACAFIAAFFIKKHIPVILALNVGLLACYSLGTAWFMFSQQVNIITALTCCVLPFLPGDLLKVIAASIIIKKLSSVISLK